MNSAGSRTLETDVCIIGSGPAGLACAVELIRAGREVLLLESGGEGNSRAAQDLNSGEVTGAPYAGIRVTRHRQVGGTATIWNTPVGKEAGGKYVPLDPWDLDRWPVSWSQLEPYYHRAQVYCGLGPFRYDAGYWSEGRRQPFQLGGTGLTSGVYQFGLASAFTKTLLAELRSSPAASLRPDTTVVGFSRSKSRGRVETLLAVDRHGDRLHVKPAEVVLAAGAIENARLLLLGGAVPDPERSWVGRGFMEHPRDYSTVLRPFSPGLFREAAFYDLHQTGSGFLVAGRLTLGEEVLRSRTLPNASVTLLARGVPRSAFGLKGRLLGAIHRLVGVPWAGGHGWSRVASPERAFDAFNLVINMEQRPRWENRVCLDRPTDRFGNRLPHLHLHWTDREQGELDSLRSHLTRWFHEAGLGRLETRIGQPPDLNAHHHAGTTRMAADRTEGVVDLDCRVFDWENLYVTGGSVFPTSGFANPTLTIVAMALRLADHLLGTRTQVNP